MSSGGGGEVRVGEALDGEALETVRGGTEVVVRHVAVAIVAPARAPAVAHNEVLWYPTSTQTQTDVMARTCSFWCCTQHVTRSWFDNG
jgi:hypothetical protein